MNRPTSDIPPNHRVTGTKARSAEPTHRLAHLAGLARLARPMRRLGRPVSPAEFTLLAMARPYARRILGAGLLATVTELAGLALMTTATWLLITAAGAPPLSSLAIAIVMVRALAVSRGALRYGERLAGHDAVLRMHTDVRARVFASLVAQPGPTAQSPRTPDALSRLVSDVDAVQDLVVRVAVPGAAAVIVAGTAVVAAGFVATPAAATLAVGLLIVGVALPAAASGLTRRTAALVAPLRGGFAIDTVDVIQGAAELTAYGRTEQAVAKATAGARDLARLERRLATLGGAVDAAGLAVIGLTAAAIVYVASHNGVPAVMVGVLAIGTLAAGESALALVAAARRRAEIQPALDRLAHLLTASDATGRTTTATNGGAAESGGAKGGGAKGRVTKGGATNSGAAPATLRLHRVSVQFRPGGRAALANAELTVAPGRRIGVVGPSGAGKSTLLAVLSGTLDTGRSADGVTGKVSVNGQPLTNTPPDQRHHIVGGLFADAYVFHASVRDNLRLGRPDAEDDDLIAACEAADLMDWVRGQPAGLDTMVGEDGAQLSGGERQRLTLARALLSAPAVLLLDEPTEGLDPTAADRILARVLAEAGPNRGVVVVTHRLRMLETFDEILVLESGRIVQRGRHRDLVGAEGWYRDQWLTQQTAEQGYLNLTDTFTAT